MPYERDQRVLDWFERVLAHHDPVVRCRALELLLSVRVPMRATWLAKATADLDPRVSRTASMVAEMVEHMGHNDEMELFESDFMERAGDSDLEWRWQYEVIVARDECIPTVPVHVWTIAEDDELAKSVAALKAFGHAWNDPTVIALVTSKTGVTRHTRSARSDAEAADWTLRGRPPFEDDVHAGEGDCEN